MACGSSCCGPAKGPTKAKDVDSSPTPSPTLPSDNDCRDEPSNIALASDKTGKASCCSNNASDLAIKPESKDPSGRDSCCSPPKPPPTSTGCKSICCSAAAAPEPSSKGNGSDTPSCCKGKSSPCCDVSCLDRLALRACEDEKKQDFALELASIKSNTDSLGVITLAGSSSSLCRGGEDGKPCGRHARTTRAKYADTLSALGCICRALLALGQESCCLSTEPSSSVERKTCSKRKQVPVSVSSGRRPAASCCATRATSCGSDSTTNARVQTKGCGQGQGVSDLKGKGRGDSCCSNPKSGKPSTSKMAASCEDDCCFEEKDSVSSENPPDGEVGTCMKISSVNDPEKGFSGREHIILSISGMTCTGCETKLKRTLGTVKSVSNLKTSLVLARAEFDLDLGTGSLEDVIKHLQRTTEFKCERVSNHGWCVDIVAPDGDAESFVKEDQQWPNGVTGMAVVDAGTVRVTYDPKLVGARDVAEKGWGVPMDLAAPRMDPTLEAGSKHVRHMGYMTLLSLVLTIPVLVMAWAPLPEREIAYGSASLALATIVQVVIAGPFYPKALKGLVFSRVIEMDLLIVLSTTAAYVFSVVSFGYLVAGQPLSTGGFFETSTLLVTLIMVGRYVAALARHKAVESISLRSLQTSSAILVDETGGSEREIDSRLLQFGDVFKVVPDSRIPTDGTVISGSSDVDESMLTGESRPVEKYPNSAVIAGTVNGSGTLVVRLSRVPGDNTINTIEAMVDEAKLSKPKIQDLADKVASYFVPVVVVLMIITLVIWIIVGVTVRNQSGSEATIQAITYAITVLIVSCPCAIGLAVPMVVVIASGVAAEKGVIFKSADSIEVAYKTAHVVFDKTGTLTEGKLTVVAEEYIDSSSSSSSASLLLGLVGSIKHPVSAAVASCLKSKGVSASSTVLSGLKTLTGKGVEGMTPSGVALRAGNSRWLNLSSNPHVQAILSQGYTAFCFTIDGSLAAVFGLDDSLRPDALSTITQLGEQNISVHVISGDDDGAVRSVATRLGIPDAHVRSRCTPADKQSYIQDLLAIPYVSLGRPNPNRTSFLPSFLRKKPKSPVVIFCGDGTNDAVALAQATIGVHMNEGTDVAKSAADVVLMRPSLSGIITTIAISRKAVGRIKFNFGWSFVYNLFAVLLGAGAFVNARIPPEFAGLGELVSVLPVIAAAVLLKWSDI